ncbi:SPOR domain-containing protein [Flammeovirgaceae bacterium SG7u.111]|nr:SPOR domain-containing protein [Flammeovirgaceae bacterium SG7u.132]WPO35181.1 SPOR domain-containing protein [Flammeovirgaceae bacterium SG7u.111]
MKNTAFAIMLLAGLAMCFNVSAQSKKDQKKDAKKWKKKMKSMDPLKFRDMYEEYNSLKAENSALRRNLEKAQESNNERDALASSKDQQLAELEQKLKDVQADCGKNVTAGGDDYTKGIVYKVQIGAFRNKELSQFQNKGKFWEEDGDGMKKYTIGYFRDYWEADSFKKYIREMGVKDAWIVAYEDNERKDIKEVLGSAEGANVE